MSRPIVFDLETTGLIPGVHVVHGVAYTWLGAKESYYETVDGLPLDIRQALENPDVPKVGQNVRFDVKHLRCAGINVRGPLLCTMNAAFILNENQRIGLDCLTEKYLGPHRLEGYKKLTALLESLGLKHVGQLAELDLADTNHPYFSCIAEYAREDVENTAALWPILEAKLCEMSDVLRSRYGADRTPIEYLYDEVMPTEELLCDVELRGLAVDEVGVARLQRELSDRKGQLTEKMTGLVGAEIRAVEEDLYRAEVATLKKADAIARRAPGRGTCKFNFSSPDHLADLLYTRLGLGPHTTRKGNLSTDDLSLQACAEETTDARVKEFLKTFGEYRNNNKNLSTYIGNAGRGFLSRTRGGRFYSDYDSRIVTGRLGSFAHTFPRDFEITRSIRPDPGNVFLYFDYAAVELRIAAHLSRDEEMLRWFNEGVDPHAATAMRLFGETITPDQRQTGKRVNFLEIYKGTPWRLQSTLKEECGQHYEIEECQEFDRIFWETHKGYAAHVARLLDFAHTHGFVIAENGRVRRLPDLALGRGIDWRRGRFTGDARMAAQLGGGTDEELFLKAKRAYSHAKKQALNFPIQTMGATFTKRACLAARRLGFNVAYTKHDSANIECAPRDLRTVYRAMKVAAENVWPGMSVPLVAEFKVLNSLNEGDRNKDLEAQLCA